MDDPTVRSWQDAAMTRAQAGQTERVALETAWLRLTSTTLPSLALERGWPIRADHCFQRVLLDHAFGGRWYDHVAQRPAYKHAPIDALARAIAIGERVARGEANLAVLNRQSLVWRKKTSGTN